MTIVESLDSHTRAKRRKRIQQPRHRRDGYGELVQIDGSGLVWGCRFAEGQAP